MTEHKGQVNLTEKCRVIPKLHVSVSNVYSEEHYTLDQVDFLMWQSLLIPLSLLITRKLSNSQLNEHFRTSAMSLFYILQKRHTVRKAAYFSRTMLYIISTLH